MADNNICFEIVKHLGVISVNDLGWQKELNLVAWNDKPAKLDIREWNQDHDRMCRGITLTEEEASALFSSLGAHFKP